jgi:hypothetical protein
MAFKDIQRIVREWYNVNVQPQVSSLHNYSYAKEIAVGIAGALLLVAGVWGYRLYAHKKESEAQVAFAENMTLYREAIQDKADLWAQVEQKSSVDYAQHKRSSVAPYLLVIKVEALINQAKHAQALEVLNDVVASLPKESPVVSLYRTKRALIKLDMADKDTQDKGLEELRSLAFDKDNKNSDVAQYYLGLHYWTHNGVAEALDIWKGLVAGQAPEKLAVSPWVSLAREKLAQRNLLSEPAPIEAPAA